MSMPRRVINTLLAVALEYSPATPSTPLKPFIDLHSGYNGARSRRRSGHYPCKPRWMIVHDITNAQTSTWAAEKE
ncbi:hypothetical protein BDR05DRAFT_965822 [Suillus weaverae]|nr:hypothetical protein BDR05DRAFT_965822 [Suillus weaverae]